MVSVSKKSIVAFFSAVMRSTELPELTVVIDPVTSRTIITSVFEISSFAVQFTVRSKPSNANTRMTVVGRCAVAVPLTLAVPCATVSKVTPVLP